MCLFIGKGKSLLKLPDMVGGIEALGIRPLLHLQMFDGWIDIKCMLVHTDKLTKI